MNDIELRRAQLTMLEILKEFKRVCNLLGLNYFLDSGTLLGAVRHGGFIPWDDDIDVGMLRADYVRFLKEAPKLLDSRFILQTWNNDEKYCLSFAKIRIVDSVYLEEGTLNLDSNNGFWIDIFPYDVLPDDEKERRKQAMIYGLLKRAILVKCGFKPWDDSSSIRIKILKGIVYLPISLYSCITPKVRLIRKYESAMSKHNMVKSRYLVSHGGGPTYGAWVIPKECLDDLVTMNYEDEEFKCPKLYREYLEAVYGDYMTPPPENERCSPHRIIEVKYPEWMSF